jgi:WD40 repeat protein
MDSPWSQSTDQSFLKMRFVISKRTVITSSSRVLRSENGAVHFWPSRFSDSLESKEVNGDSIYLDNSPLVDHSDAITCIHVVGSRTGQEGHVATASEDGTIQLYKVRHRE